MRLSEISNENRLFPILQGIDLDLDQYYNNIVKMFDIMTEMNELAIGVGVRDLREELFAEVSSLREKIKIFDELDFMDPSDPLILLFRKKHTKMLNSLATIEEYLR